MSKSQPFSSNAVRWSAATLGLLGAALGFNAIRDANASPPDVCVLEQPIEPVQVTPLPVVIQPNGTSNAACAQLQASLSQGTLVRGADGELYLHCGVTVNEDPRVDAPRRPLDLALVLDTSGSMQNAMELLRQATLGAVERMGPDDRLTIVAYSSSARLVYSGYPAREERATLEQLIQGLQATGNTHLSAGIELAEQHLSGDMRCRCLGDCDHLARPGAVKRMLVLTDGLANLGVTDPQGLAAIVTRVRSHGSAVTSLGLGAQFNEELLANLADAGGGTYHYVSQAGALDAVYTTEVEAMQALAAKDAELVIQTQDGTLLSEVYYWPSAQDPDARTVSLGDLSRGRSLKVMARIQVGTQLPGATVDVVNVSLRFTDPDTQERVTLDPVALSVGLTEDAQAAAESVNDSIVEDLTRVRVARQLDRAREAAKAGRSDEARRLAMECKEIAGEDGLNYATAEGEAKLDFDALADDLGSGADSERGRAALKQSHAAQMGAAR
ncbi:MAG: VWA domain-containing protein [Planctomycetota bacterium]